MPHRLIITRNFILSGIAPLVGFTGLMRFVFWAFVGNKYAHWKAILPIGKGYWCTVKAYLSGAKSGDAPQYLGHNPVGKLMVALLFLLLSAQLVTGLVLAGTDLYFPPFGHEVAEWVTGAGEEHAKIANLKPGSKDDVDSEAYAAMRAFRKPFITTHVCVFYTLLVATFLHIAAVVITEIREGNGLVSAMFAGKKVASKRPVDLDD